MKNKLYILSYKILLIF